MRFRSPTTLISLGLACLTLSLVLMAHTFGIAPDDTAALVRARTQVAELVAAHCSAAAAANDVKTIQSVATEVASRNSDIVSAGVRDSHGQLIFESGPHSSTWETGQRGNSPVIKVREPILNGSKSWGRSSFASAARAWPPRVGCRGFSQTCSAIAGFVWLRSSRSRDLSAIRFTFGERCGIWIHQA